MQKKIHKKLLEVLILITCFFIINGCAPMQLKNSSIPTDFLSKKRSVGIIWIKESEEFKAQFLHYGAGLYRILHKENQKKLIERLNQEDESITVKKYYLHLFRNAFMSEGMDVKSINNPYYIKTMKKFKLNYSNNKNFYYLDFRPIGDELDVDYLLVLQIIMYGIDRDYGPFGIPMSPPKGSSQVRCTLIESKSNKVIASYFVWKAVYAHEEWDEPPEYSNLMRALYNSFEISIDEIFINFFGRNP